MERIPLKVTSLPYRGGKTLPLKEKRQIQSTPHLVPCSLTCKHKSQCDIIVIILDLTLPLSSKSRSRSPMRKGMDLG